MSLQHFEQAERRRNLSTATIRDRRRILLALQRCLAADVLTATAGQIEEWLDSCKIGPRSRYSYLSHLNAFFEWAVDTELATSNPVAKIPRPRLPKLVARPMREDDYAFALGMADARMKCWLLLAGYGGLRCQEIAGVRREDFRFGSPSLLVVTAGKGGKERVVPLHPDTESALRAFGLPTRGYVFTHRGQPYRPARISKLVAEWLRAIGVDCTAHQLRHRYGTRLYRLTKDPVVVQEMLGHSDLRTTSIYIEYDPTVALAALDGLRV